jgi:hypothetical protein
VFRFFGAKTSLKIEFGWSIAPVRSTFGLYQAPNQGKRGLSLKFTQYTAFSLEKGAVPGFPCAREYKKGWDDGIGFQLYLS